MLELHLGRVLTDGEQALHTCDNPPCINPDHLFVGTQTDNVADMVAKGRNRQGENPAATDVERRYVTYIREQRAIGRPLKAIARELGVALSTVSRIANGRRWSNV